MGLLARRGRGLGPVLRRTATEDRRGRVPEIGFGLRSCLAIGIDELRQRDACGQALADGFRVGLGFARSCDAETPEAIEAAVARIDGESGEIDGDTPVARFDRPKDRSAGPCLAAFHEVGQGTVRVQIERFDEFGEIQPDHVGRARTDRLGEFGRDRMEAAVMVDAPDETHWSAIEGGLEGAPFCRNIGGVL